MEFITIKNEYLTVKISQRGAEILSVLDRFGRERIWEGDVKFWDSHAPILFPICGGFKENRYLMGEESYPMSKHGFAKTAVWSLKRATEDCAEFLLTEKHPGYPFVYELTACYRLIENKIEITYTVKNCDRRDMWFSIGSHEAYALPNGVDGVSVDFDEAETLARYDLVDGNLLKKEPVIMGTNTKKLKFCSSYFREDGMQAMVFPYLKSRGLTLFDDKEKPIVRVEYDGMDALLFWTKRGAGYLCIEPWCNAPDFVDTNMRIEDKKGCIWLSPGQSVEKKHTVAFH